MPAKPIFTDDQHRIMREVVEKLLRTTFKKDQKKLALALGIAQQTVSHWTLAKYRPSLRVATDLAVLDGHEELEDLIGPYGQPKGAAPTKGGDRPNLDTCISFHAATKHWHPWTLAAARAGIFGPTDFAPPEWTSKLDSLEESLARFQKGAGA